FTFLTSKGRPLPLPFLSVRAPVGHVDTHCPQNSQLSNERGFLNAVSGIDLNPLPVISMVPAITTSLHILVHRPHKIHLFGSYVINGLSSRIGRSHISPSKR